MKRTPDACDAYEALVIQRCLAAVDDARVARGWSAAQLARRSGLSLRTVTYACGLRKRAGLRTLIALLSAVGLGVEFKIRPLRSADTNNGHTTEGQVDVVRESDGQGIPAGGPSITRGAA